MPCAAGRVGEWCSHGEDFTYSVLIPRASAGSRVSPPESYRAIHGALCATLAGMGIPATPASSASVRISQACFENPVLHDVMANGRKIAGAAQRRTRLGLLHQGSVQGLRLSADFGSKLAEGLSAAIRLVSFEIPHLAAALARKKYASPEWLGRTP